MIKKSIDKFEKFCLVITVFSIFCIFIFNSLANYNRYYDVYYKNYDDLQHNYLVLQQQGTVTIEIIGDKVYPHLEILLNGESYKKFHNENTSVIMVKDGDVVQINGSMYNEDIQLKVVNVSYNVKLPQPPKTVYISRNIKTLSRVEI
ncbi:hypothetical protein [Natronincola ferrireducens]|uniref:Uncharacterized protein n=1 Tax=Natronincola ferrireducens TaxID=393762 RepID=A0A1G9CA47_9FIRM|nr:hypothetical protein [Natronincola ferrireducens]SDK48526.1 hypothetical protein SAMN05660472_01408 [Natronincola ferrireducens]